MPAEMRILVGIFNDPRILYMVINRCKIFSQLFLGCVLVLIYFGCSNENRVKQIDADNYEAIAAVDSLTNSSNDGPVISAVSLLVTDKQQNIYLVDPRTKKIHSFTSDFSYRWSVGGKGNGPGLFNTISALHIKDEYLYVYESRSSMVSSYSLNGERIDEWTFGEEGHRINSVRPMGGGTFLTTGWNEKMGTVLNIYDSSFQNRIAQFNNYKNIIDTEVPGVERQVFRNYPGSVISANDSMIVYGPPAYKGRLQVFRKQSNQKWEKSTFTEGYTYIQKPLVLHKSQDGNNERSHLSGFHPDGGYFHAEFYSMSHGLYRLKNNEIAHLSTRLNGNDKWDLVIEYFDPDSLKLNNYKIAKGLISSQQFQQVPLWMDESGKVYVNKNSDTPLRVLTLDKGQSSNL